MKNEKEEEECAEELRNGYNDPYDNLMGSENSESEEHNADTQFESHV